MGANSAISWTDHTFNPWWGCTKIATGCTNCYASAFSKRTGHDVWGDKAPRRFFGEKHWNEPRKWNSIAEKNGVRFRVFCGSMCDVFEDRPELDVPRSNLMDLILDTPHLGWLLLTKRPQNASLFFPWQQHGYAPSWPKNVMVGASICEQRDTANLHDLVEIHARRFLSCEPLVAQLAFPGALLEDVSWLIIGGESGPGHRTMNLEHLRLVVDQADAFDVPVFVKQDSGPYPGKQGRIPDELWARKEFPIRHRTQEDNRDR